MGGTKENPYAGQGPVLLDIGGDVGALVVVMPPDTGGLEVELRPAGATDGAARAADRTQQDRVHRHGESEHDHHHGGREHAHHHDDAHDHAHAHADASHAAYPHVGVVARPDGETLVHSLVYPAVTEGEYELYVLPDGPVAMTASVSGGRVTRNRWPA